MQHGREESQTERLQIGLTDEGLIKIFQESFHVETKCTSVKTCIYPKSKIIENNTRLTKRKRRRVLFQNKNRNFTKLQMNKIQINLVLNNKYSTSRKFWITKTSLVYSSLDYFISESGPSRGYIIIIYGILYYFSHRLFVKNKPLDF